jgi:hypothetical protein
MEIVKCKRLTFCCAVLVLLPAIAAGLLRLPCQQRPSDQSDKPVSSGKTETPGNQRKAAKPESQRSEREKKEQEKAQQEREKQIRERALYLADTMLDYKDLSDKLEAASMKADFASLVCACGQRERAVEIARKSLKEAFLYALQNHDDKGAKAGRLSPEAVMAQLAEAATKCDPASRKLIEADLARMRPASEQPNGEASETDPPVVADDLWGTKPSLRRSAAALLLVHSALDQLEARRQAEAENLLYQSLKYCVTTEFVVALAKIKSDPVGAQSLFLQAERQVASLSSGQEMSALDFGLPLITGTSRYADRVAAIVQKAAELDPTTLRLIGGELDAVTALVVGNNALLVAGSVDAIRMVRDKLPLFAQFRPDALEPVQSWVDQAIQALSPGKRDIALRVPSAPLPPTDQASAIQEIADKLDDDARKDEAYASLASTYIDDGKFEKAAEAVAKISNVDLRTEMQDALSFSQIGLLISKSTEYGELSGRIEKISSVRLRMKLYTELGAAAFKKDPLFASQCLHWAEALSSKLDRSAVQSHLLLDIAAVFADFDPIEAMQALHEAVMSINHHDDQPPTRWAGQYVATTTVKFDAKFSLGRAVVDDSDEYKRKPYDLSAFKKIAERDFDGGLLEASSIGNKSIMASAKYELCAAILQKKQPSPQPAKPPAAVPADAPPPPPKAKPAGELR